ncbi:hypothetical protein A9P82_12990 [Arachidicoccus ginsenosidimutans]|nr:hypothetical protein A9P82_12990 [Arachidicoccus sp. BS20]
MGGGISDNSFDIDSSYTLVENGFNNNSIVGPISICANIDSIEYSHDYLLIKQIPQFKDYEQALMRDLLLFLTIDKKNKYSYFDESFIQKQAKILRFVGNNGDSDQKTLKQLADSILNSSVFYKKIFTSGYCWWLLNKQDTVLDGPFDRVKYDSIKINFRSQNFKVLKVE